MSKNIWARAVSTAFVATMALAIAGAPASAQTGHSTTLTPAGTAIKNIATVTYQDSTGNNYTSKDSVIVTVGKYADIDVRRWADSVYVASPSTNDTVTFTIQNFSNDSTQIDFVQIDSAENVVSSPVSKWFYNGTVYTSLADLKTAVGYVHQGDSIVVKVIYDVQSGKGGLYDWLGLTASTVIQTDGGTVATDSDQTKVITTLTGSVVVTPDDSTVMKLPGTGYVLQFYVKNSETGSDTFTLTDSLSATNTAGVTIQKMYLCSDGSKTPVTSTGLLAAGDSVAICVEYSMANNGPGSTGSVYLRAISTTTGTVTDIGWYNVTTAGPSISIAKEAYLDDNGTMSATKITGVMTVLPHQYIWYKMTVTNNSTTDNATSIEITDVIPTQVIYVSTTDSGGWTYTGSDLDHSGTDTLKAQLASLAKSGSAWVAIRVQIK